MSRGIKTHPCLTGWPEAYKSPIAKLRFFFPVDKDKSFRNKRKDVLAPRGTDKVRKVVPDLPWTICRQAPGQLRVSRDRK